MQDKTQGKKQKQEKQLQLQSKQTKKIVKIILIDRRSGRNYNQHIDICTCTGHSENKQWVSKTYKAACLDKKTREH